MLLPIIPNDAPDRRRRVRLPLAYRLRVHLNGEASLLETTTDNISCEGFSCITRRVFFPRQILECELWIPGEDLGRQGEPGMILHCRAEVVRVAPQQDGARFSVACRFVGYTIESPTVDHDLAMEYST